MTKPIISFATSTAVNSAINAYATADGRKNAAHIEAAETLQTILASGRPADDWFAHFYARVDAIKGATTPDAERGRFKGAVRMAEMSYCATFMAHAKVILPSITYLGRLAAWCRKDFKDPSNGPTLDQMRDKLKALQAESNAAKSTKGDATAADGEAKADDKVTADKRLARVIAAATDYVAKAGDAAGHVAIALQHLNAEMARLTTPVAPTPEPEVPATPVVKAKAAKARQNKRGK